MNRLVAVLALAALGWPSGWTRAETAPSSGSGVTNAPSADIKEYTPIPPPIVMPPKPPEPPAAEPSAPPAKEPLPVEEPPAKPEPPPAVKPPKPLEPALPPTAHPRRGSREDREWSLAVQYAQPSSSDFWDTGIGGEAQYRAWPWNDWGWAISGGYASWDSAPPVVPFPAEGYNPSMEGSATLYSLGASMVRRTLLDDGDVFRFEAGLRYIFFESDVVAKFNYENHYGQPTHLQVPVNVDDHLAAVVNFLYEMRIDEDWSWFFGLGYQLDLTGTDTDWALETFDTAADGLRAQLGLTWTLD